MGGADEPFFLQTRKQDRRALVELQGAVDSSTANEVTVALSRLADDDVDELVVDLTAATMADTAALGALVLAQKEARRRHRDVVLAGVGAETRRLLELTGLDRTFRVVSAAERL